MEGRLLYTLVGCNRVVACLDWSRCNGRVAFGAHHFIAIYSVEAQRIVGILNGHTGQVNCVKWMNIGRGDVDDCLVTGSADKTVHIWKWKDDRGEKLAVLQGFATGVTALAVHVRAEQSSQPSVLVAACSSDHDVRIWSSIASSSMEFVDWNLMTTIHTGQCIQHSACLAPLPSHPSCLVLALGGTDSVVRLFLQSDDRTFRQVCSLQGHEDWVRGLDIYVQSESKLILASASQDRFVRVWSVNLDDDRRTSNPLSQLAPSLSFRSSKQLYSVKLEGLLTGHEDWVHSVQFHAGGDRIQLLTASMDRTMILWEWDAQHQCWLQTESVGDAGCSVLGYFSGVFSPDGQSILAHGYTGALHLWQKDDDTSGWMPRSALSGHYDSIVDMCFAVSHQSESTDPVVSILTVSKDQTTRISAMLDGNWREIARPQVHGHDFLAVAPVPKRRPDCFVSCSEEKVIRVFTAPSSFHQYLHANKIITTVLPAPEEHKRLAYGASIKALALTNTALYEDDIAQLNSEEKLEGVVGEYTPGPDFAPHANPSCISGAPFEEHLSQNTLWPESQKLYGHGDIVYSLAVSPCGDFLASACKAQKEDGAAIYLWDTSTWKLLQQLRGHSLTVTRMEFSGSSKYLLSGSRDRTFCIYEQHETHYNLKLRKAKAHARIIWDVSWAPDETHFATGSRDQSIKVWKLPSAECVLQIPFGHGVTALAFRPNLSDSNSERLVLASGLQNGDLSVWSIASLAELCSCQHLWTTEEHNKHADAVHRVKWTTASSLEEDAEETGIILASCSADHSLRLFILV